MSYSLERKHELLNIFGCAFAGGAEVFTAMSSGLINAAIHGETFENFLIGALLGAIPIPVVLGIIKRFSL